MNFITKLHFGSQKSLKSQNIMKLIIKSFTTNFPVPHEFSREIYSAQKLRGKQREHITIHEGDHHNGFICKGVKSVSELNMTAYHFIHEKTKAEYVHLDTEDLTNYFSVQFRTPAINSTGLTHILEHLVLCGSKNYTVGGDVFTLMKKSSLSSYMNAQTYCDRTAFPFATAFIPDFANLVAVYCDAVFHPNLNPIDFAQEGYRYFVKTEGRNQEFGIKGVVFSEMKSFLTLPDSLFDTKIAQKLYTKTPYVYIFGGDPEQIPELQLPTLINYWKTHYHPSNCLFYTSGDISPLLHLQYFGDYVLKDYEFNSESHSITVNPVTRWTNERKEWMSCPVDPFVIDRQKELLFCKAYLTSHASEINETKLFQLLSLLLTQGPQSLFYKSLVETNLVKDILSTSGANDDYLESSFRIILNGLDEKGVLTIGDTINRTLKAVVKKGFNPELIESALNKMELETRTIQPCYVNLFTNITKFWTHHLDIFAPLSEFEALLILRKELTKSDSKYLNKFIHTRLLHNNHVLNLTMVPDDNYFTQINQSEVKKCKKVQLLTSPQQKKKMMEIDEEIEKRHRKIPNHGLLPQLTVDDIPLNFPHDVTKHITFPIHNHQVHCSVLQVPTNNINYIRYLRNCNHISTDLLPYLPLYCQCLGKMGTKNMTFDSFSTYTDLYTSGYNHAPLLRISPDDVNQYNLSLFFSTGCLHRNVQPALEHYQKLIEKPSFDDLNRLKFLIESSVITYSQAMSDTSDLYTSLYAASEFGDCYKKKEILDGYTQVKFMRDMSDSLNDKTLSGIRDKLYQIHDSICHSSDIEFLVVHNENTDKELLKDISELLPYSPTENSVAHYLQNTVKKIQYKNTFFGHNRPVSTSVHCMQGVCQNSKNYGTLKLLSEILDSNFLHREIRENQGAYGTNCRTQDGLWFMSSYADPSPLSSLDVYKKAFDWIEKGEFTESDINDAKLVLVGGLCEQYPPNLKGLREFLNFDTPESIEEKMRIILKSSKTDLLNCYKEVIKPNIENVSQAIWGTKRDCPLYRSKKWDVLEFSP